MNIIMHNSLVIDRRDVAVARALPLDWVIVTPIVLAVGISRIIASGAAPIFDQATLIRASLNNFPTISDGYSAALISALLNAVHPSDQIGRDVLMRMLSFAFFIVSHQLLASAVLPSMRARLLLLAALVCTPIPVLWLSSELQAASWLALFFWSIWTGRHFSISSFFLMAFACAKPDLLFSAVVLIAVYGYYEGVNKAARLMICAPLVIVPEWMINGWQGFSMQTRSFNSLSQHYAALVAGPSAGLGPWVHTDRYMAAWRGHPTTLVSAVLLDPLRYGQFVLMSARWSLQSLWRSGLVPLVIVLPLAVVHLRTDRFRRALILAPLAGVLPMLAMSFMHVRYTPRLRTALLALVGLALAHAIQDNDKRSRLWLAGALVASVIWTLPEAVMAWATGYYFPD